MQTSIQSANSDKDLQRVARKRWERTKQNAHSIYLKGLKQIELAAAEGRRPNRLGREFIHSNQNLMSAVLKSLAGQPQPEEVFHILNLANPWSTETYRVNWRYENKPKGGLRTICTLPIHLKAIHKMIGHILRAQMLPNDNLYGISSPKHSELARANGYSRDDAITHIQNLRQAGFHRMAEFDVVGGFPSVNPDALYAFPLPEEVIRQALDTRNIHFQTREQGRNSFSVPTGSITIRNPHGPSGLMQGSPASNIIFAYFLNGILNDLPECEDTKVIVCFDNIVIASRTDAGLQEMSNTLAGTLRQCCAGPFELHPPVYSNDEGFEFLGYHLSADGRTIGIAPSRLSKLEAKLGELESLSADRPTVDIIGIWKAIASFANGYSRISDPREQLSLYLENTETILSEADLSNLVTLQDMLFSPKGSHDRKIVNRILSM